MASRNGKDPIGTGLGPIGRPSGTAFALPGFVVEPAANELVADDGTRTHLEARAMDVLVLLHRHAGEVVSIRAILAAVWGEAAVSAHSVAIVISDLRKALRDDARAPRLIETLPKRGYRLIEGSSEAVAAKTVVAVDHRERSLRVRSGLAALAGLAVLGLLFTVTRGGGWRRSSESEPLDAASKLRYEHARDLWSRREPEGAMAARQLLEEVLATRADFAPAHAAMADLYVHKTGEYLGVTPLQAFRVGQWHVDRALALDPDQPDVPVTLALLAFYRDRQPRKALAELERALQLDPNSARAWQAQGMVLSSVGEHAASLAAIRKARVLDPVSPSAAWDEVWFLYLAGRFEEAHEAAVRASSYSPRNYLYEALIEEGRGRREQALGLWLDRLDQSAVRVPRAAEIRALAAAGRFGEAYLELLHQRLAMAGPREWGTVVAIWQLLAGEEEAAVETVGAIHWESEHWTRIWLPEMPVFAELAARADVRTLLNRTERTLDDRR